MTGVIAPFAAACAVLAGTAGMRRMIGSGATKGPLRLPAVVAATTRGQLLGVALQRAGLRCGPDLFIAATVAATLAVGAAAWLIVRNPVVALIAAGSVTGGAQGFVRSSERRYLERFAAQLPVVTQQLGSALGAGLSLRQAISRAAEDAPEPAATEMERVARELRLGARTDEALAAFSARLPDAGLRMLVTAIQVQRVVGGNLAQALTQMSSRLEERATLEREARSATAQARMSAWLVAALPLAGGVLVEIAAPGTLARTIGHGPGLGLLIVATLLELVGVVAIRQILRSGEER